MHLSVGESHALLTKAARGAGLSWGMAEECSFAACWLTVRRLPGVEAATTLLTWHATDPEDQSSSALYHGVRIMDACQMHVPNTPVRQPLLMVPFLAQITDTYMTVKWADAEISFSKEYAFYTGAAQPLELFDEQALCTLEAATFDGSTDRHARNNKMVDTGHQNDVDEQADIARTDNADAVLQSRVDVSEKTLSQLNALAAKTYAPATEASRIKGAGSSLDDND